MTIPSGWSLDTIQDTLWVLVDRNPTGILSAIPLVAGKIGKNLYRSHLPIHPELHHALRHPYVVVRKLLPNLGQGKLGVRLEKVNHDWVCLIDLGLGGLIGLLGHPNQIPFVH
ncbi:hypothetical protein DSO57_1028663 [Entomophthora muscae]|uniref:Uncharacterized protein n=1 Tax=Entomophthora muscae TaxID=34485 RepID=A0ACC2RGA0_9FUNG|nr:hypothetical protein DSO57_1028663 [Entomophthora muscae]